MNKWIIGMEYSGRIRNAMRKIGIDAWSVCNIESEDNSPYHIVGNVLDYLEDTWDGAIFHPHCTRFTLAGICWMYHPEDSHLDASIRRRHPKYPNRMQEFESDVETFHKLQNCKIPKKAIENSQPHGLAMSRVGKYDQKIQPYWFGDPYTKGACWWLYGLPKLVPTNIIPLSRVTAKSHLLGPSPERWKERSRTEPGVAMAISEQWGEY